MSPKCLVIWDIKKYSLFLSVEQRQSVFFFLILTLTALGLNNNNNNNNNNSNNDDDDDDDDVMRIISVLASFKEGTCKIQYSD